MAAHDLRARLLFPCYSEQTWSCHRIPSIRAADRAVTRLTFHGLQEDAAEVGKAGILVSFGPCTVGPGEGEVGGMGVTLETRKPIDHLTTSDLSTFPVWEFALDEEGIEGRDETWVRPLNTQIVPKGQYSLTVAADFKAACGRTYSGFVGVTTAPIRTNDPVTIMDGVILHGT